MTKERYYLISRYMVLIIVLTTCVVTTIKTFSGTSHSNKSKQDQFKVENKTESLEVSNTSVREGGILWLTMKNISKKTVTGFNVLVGNREENRIGNLVDSSTSNYDIDPGQTHEILLSMSNFDNATKPISILVNFVYFADNTSEGDFKIDAEFREGRRAYKEQLLNINAKLKEYLDTSGDKIPPPETLHNQILGKSEQLKGNLSSDSQYRRSSANSRIERLFEEMSKWNDSKGKHGLGYGMQGATTIKEAIEKIVNENERIIARCQY